MRRASAINLVLLGGGLTLFGAAGVLNEHNRLAACEARRVHKIPGEPDECKTHPGSAYGGHGWGGFGHGGSSYGQGRGGGFFGIARGGFGGFGAGHGGGGE